MDPQPSAVCMDDTPEVLRRAIEAAGDIYVLAERVGVSYQAVQKWIRNRRVPAERVLAVERATGRRVRRSEIRPDLYPPRRKPRARLTSTSTATSTP